MWLELQGGKNPLAVVLSMAWHNSTRLGKATEEEAGMWAEIEIIVKIWG